MPAQTLPAWFAPGAHITDHTTAWDPLPGQIVTARPWSPPRTSTGVLLVEWAGGDQEWLSTDDAATLRCGLPHRADDPCTQCENPPDPAVIGGDHR